MLLALKLKLAAKTCLVAASILGVTQTVPHPGHEHDIPETVLVSSAPFDYRRAGDFQEAGRPVDGPREMLRVPSFRITKFQVTATQYDMCAEAGACRPRGRMQDADPALPAVLLSFEDARSYAAWLSQLTGDLWRLPSDVEWIAAAGSRASDEGLKLPREADISERWLARYDKENAKLDEGTARPIGSFGVNEHGVADVAGNIWEWTDTCFTRYAVGRGGVRASTVNCGVRVVEGSHRTYMTNFVRDARAGGCAVGKPPSNLGIRLVKEVRPVRRAVTLLLRGV